METIRKAIGFSVVAIVLAASGSPVFVEHDLSQANAPYIEHDNNVALSPVIDGHEINLAEAPAGFGTEVRGETSIGYGSEVRGEAPAGFGSELRGEAPAGFGSELRG
jgi:hypothetical protein